MECKYCSINKYETLRSLRNHERFCKSNPNRIVSNLIELNKIQNVSNTKRKEQGKKLSEKYKRGDLEPHKTPHTEKTKKKLSKIAKERNLGGYVMGSGRGKKGWYKGFFCDSSWELAYVIYNIEHKIPIERNREKRKYVFGGKKKNYIPDFIVNGELVEIKGYKSEEWEAKHLANKDVKVLYEKDLSHILKYVVDKYGKDFIKLYE